MQLKPMVCIASPSLLFWVASQKLVDMSGDPRERQWLHQGLSLAVVRGNAASILACVQVWADIICSFLAAFSVLTSVAARHLPLFQCIAIAFRILVLSVRFIVPSVVQCYFAHWLTILSIAQPVMRLQRGVMFHIAWKLWGISFKKIESAWRRKSTATQWDGSENKSDCFSTRQTRSVHQKRKYFYLGIEKDKGDNDNGEEVLFSVADELEIDLQPNDIQRVHRLGQKRRS